MPLNMTRIAFGAESHAHLRQRLEAHASIGEVRLTTRYLPKRHEEMAGGSLYWILNHSLIGRSPLIGFMDNGEVNQLHRGPSFVSQKILDFCFEFAELIEFENDSPVWATALDQTPRCGPQREIRQKFSRKIGSKLFAVFAKNT